MDELAFLSALWSAAGILVAFQTAALTLRINREIDVSKTNDLTWLPLADWINILSIVVTLVGVLVARAVDLASVESARTSFAFAALLLAGYPFALAGHYDMFTPNTRRSRQFCTFQEAIAISIVFCSAAILLLWIHRMPLQAVALMVPLSAIVLTAWWQIWRTVNMRRAAREQAQVINQAAKELDAMILAAERLFVNKTTNLYKDYDDAVDAILSAGPSEVVKRKMLRAHKSKIYAEIGEWESDLRQIRGLLEEARRGTARLAVSEEDISAIARDAVSGADETVWRTRASAANIYEFMDRTGIPSRIKRVKE